VQENRNIYGNADDIKYASPKIENSQQPREKVSLDTRRIDADADELRKMLSE